MYKRFASLIPLFAAGGLSLQAQQTCSNSTLLGTYYYLASGSVISGGQPLPFAELAKFVFDGKGGVTGQAATNDNGVSASFSFAGMYSVQASCKGGLTLSADPPAAGPFDFQILDGGKSITMAFSGPGGVIVGQAYPATSGTVQCGRGLFTGSYAFQFTGTANGLLRSEEGQIVSDGDVNLSVSSVLDINGSPQLNPGTGTYSLHSDCSGSAFIGSQSGNANYSFGMVDNGRSILFLRTDSGTVVSGKAQTQALTASVLPDFVFGGGFYSAIYFANTGSTAVSFPINFFGDAGGPLTVPSLHGSTTTINLPPQGTAIIEAPNDGPLVQGFASMFLPSGVVSYGIFRKSTAGVPDQEAIVPLSEASSTRRTLVWDDTNYVTAVAIANPSAVANIVTITVRDDAGNLIGNPTISLGANSKTAVVLRNVPGLSGMAGKRGFADFSVVAGNVAVLGLRFNGQAFTSIPTVDR